MLFQRGHRYGPIRSELGAGNEATWKKALCSGVSIIALLAVAAGLGFIIGQQTRDDLLTPAGHVDRTFIYDKRCGQRPEEDSDQLWQDLFPKGRGFVHNPEISPDIVGLSVYHQLHCLDAIRRSFYAVQDNTQGDESSDGNDQDRHAHHASHIRHCIDYLRQSLMCHADTNVEPIDIELGGINGWHSPRKCRDYEGLVAWTDKWRTHNQTVIT